MVKYDWVSGQKFCKLTLTGKSYSDPNTRKRIVEVICDCGVIKWVVFDSVKTGRTTSCGCAMREKLKLEKPATTHGKSSHRLYVVYRNMIRRCYNPKDDRYYCYGERGIIVCDEWLNDFNKFFNWCIENDSENPLKTLDRINPNGNYEPSNCRWAIDEVQRRNKTNNVNITAFGETKCLAAWEEDERCPVTALTINKRLKRGWDEQTAITKPNRDNGYKKSK